MFMNDKGHASVKTNDIPKLKSLSLFAIVQVFACSSELIVV